MCSASASATGVKPKRILFICTGNICRSPAAEAVLRQMAAGKNWEIESAGTGNWHVGDEPDERAVHAATERGYSMEGIVSRQIKRDDLYQFDQIYAMTQEHYHFLMQLKESEPTASAEIFLFLTETLGVAKDVADPYYNSEVGFEVMMDCLEAGCAKIIEKHS